MSELVIVDTESIKWDNGLDVIKTMTPEFRDNLGPADAVAKAYAKFNQKTLRIDPKTTRRGDLIRLEPGYSDVTHAYHDSVEECLVLEGDCYLYGEEVLEKGDYFWRPPGWVHSAKTDRGFVALLLFEGKSEGDKSGPVSRRVRPAEDLGTNGVYKDHETAIGPRGWVKRLHTSLVPRQRGPIFARSEGPLDGYDLEHISFKVLSKNPITGAQSLLVRLDPGYRQASRGRHSATQQFFVLSGSLSIGGTEIRKGGYVYRVRGLVQPPVVSNEGALLFMKVDGWLDFHRVRG